MIQEKHFNYYFTKKREFESQKTPVQKLFHFIAATISLSLVFKFVSQSNLGSISADQSEKAWKEPYGNRKFRRISSRIRKSRWKWNYLEMIWGLKLIFGNCFNLMIFIILPTILWNCTIFVFYRVKDRTRKRSCNDRTKSENDL